MALPKHIKEELGIFNDACNDFINSKLILIEKSISSVLSTIAKRGQIYSVIAGEIVGYNFQSEYETAANSGSFDLVLNEESVIPFVFNLLNEMDNGAIDIFAFIKQMFGANDEKAYKSFCDLLIKNFMERVKQLLEEKFIDEEKPEEESPETEETSIDPAFLDRIKFVTENIIGGLQNPKLQKLKTRSDINTVCVSIIICISNNQTIGVLGLLIGLRHMLVKVKQYKNDIQELDLIIKAFNEL